MGHEIKLVAHFFSSCALTAQVICWGQRASRPQWARSKKRIQKHVRTT